MNDVIIYFSVVQWIFMASFEKNLSSKKVKISLFNTRVSIIFASHCSNVKKERRVKTHTHALPEEGLKNIFGNLSPPKILRKGLSFQKPQVIFYYKIYYRPDESIFSKALQKILWVIRERKRGRISFLNFPLV